MNSDFHQKLISAAELVELPVATEHFMVFVINFCYQKLAGMFQVENLHEAFDVIVPFDWRCAGVVVLINQALVMTKDISVLVHVVQGIYDAIAFFPFQVVESIDLQQVRFLVEDHVTSVLMTRNVLKLVHKPLQLVGTEHLFLKELF